MARKSKGKPKSSTRRGTHRKVVVATGGSGEPRSLDVMGQAWWNAWRRPDRRKIYEWARENVILPPGVYTITGAFDVTKSRFLIEPFEALQDDQVRVVVLMAPPRSGKSLLGDIWLPWTFGNAPGPFMWNMATDKLASRHHTTRVLPLLRAVPGVKELLPEDPRKQTATDLFLRNGFPLYVQGPSMDNLQGIPVRYLVEDELWRRRAGIHQEAKARLGDYEKIHASKMLVIGQGGIEDDDMDLEFREGHMAEWCVPCLECGVYFIPVCTGYQADGERYGLVWPDEARDKNGNWDKDRVMETVLYRAPCGHEHRDCARTMAAWNERGRYEAQRGDALAAFRSYHVWATCTRAWMLIAEDLAKALNAYKSGLLDQLQAFTQKWEARSWSESLVLQSLKSPTYEGSAEWPEETHRVLTVDHQENGVNWGLVVAASKKTGELRRLWYGSLVSDADIKAKQEEFGIRNNRVFVDSGWDTKTVYAWCVRHGWIALKGSDKLNFAHQVKVKVGGRVQLRTVLRSYSKIVRADPEAGKVAQGRKFATLVLWSNPTIKNAIKGLLDRGRILEPEVEMGPNGPVDPNEVEYRKQMKGQWRVKIRNQITGRVKFEWRDNGNDHARDCWNQAGAVFRILGVLPDIEPAEGGEVDK